jgi:sugar lactone lactonase YvrE
MSTKKIQAFFAISSILLRFHMRISVFLSMDAPDFRDFAADLVKFSRINRINGIINSAMSNLITRISKSSLFIGFSIFVAGILLAAPAAATEPPNFIRQWGSYGTDDGQFLFPHGIAIDSSGMIYTTDDDLDRITKFTGTGGFVTKWGGGGTLDGHFDGMTAIAVGPNQHVYVIDTGNNRVQEFTGDGFFVRKWGRNGGDGSYGSGDGEFEIPIGIDVDTDGNVYVADLLNHRIQKFTAEGVYITQWGSYGTGNGQFDRPYAVSVSEDGFVYVIDALNFRIQKFTNDGVYLLQWGSEGSGDGELNYPSDLFAAGGYIYVADTKNHRIQIFDGGGLYLFKWGRNGGDGTEGSAPGQFDFPAGIVLDAAGRIYVMETNNRRVQKFGYVSPVEDTSWGSVKNLFGPGR